VDGRLTPIEQKIVAGDAAGARALADAMLGDASLPATDRFAALMLRARAFELLRDLPRAIVDVDGALALDPANARAWNELGILCADAGLSGRAIDAFVHATKADPKYPRGWNNLGNALRDAGRPNESLAAFERAVAIDDKYALAWANVGAMRRLAGDDVRAEKALRRAVALDPGARAAMMTLGGLLHDRSDLAPAAELFLDAARLDGKDATACLELAQTLAERDDLVSAREAFMEAERRDPRMLRATIGRNLVLPMVANSNLAVVQGLAQNGVQMKSEVLATGYGQDLLDQPAAKTFGPEVVLQNGYAPVELKTKATKQFQADLKKVGVTGVPDFGAYTGYASCDLAILGLKNAGNPPVQANFSDNLRKIGSYDAAGLACQPIDISAATFGKAAPTNCGWFVQIKNGKYVPFPSNGKPVKGKLIAASTQATTTTAAPG